MARYRPYGHLDALVTEDRLPCAGPCGRVLPDDSFHRDKTELRRRCRVYRCKECLKQHQQRTGQRIRCIDCGNEKGAEFFYRVRKGSAKRQSRCIQCDKAIRKRNYSTDPNRQSKKPCDVCADLPHRRDVSPCPDCGLERQPMHMPDVVEILETWPVNDRRTVA